MNAKKVMVIRILIIVILLMSSSISSAKDWKYASFLPPPHWANYCNSWLLNEIEERTNGQIKTKMYVAESLGKARETYQLVVNRIADIGEFVLGSAPGVFPLSEVLQLPFLWSDSLEGSIVANDLLRKGYLDKTLTRDVKTISMNMTETQKIWTSKPIKSLEDLKGVTLRVVGGLDAEIVKSLGAVPIMLPLPEVYQSLEKGVVDGGLFGFATAIPFKVPEVCKYVLDIPISTAIHIHIMNKKLYNSLPTETQKILDEIFRENEIHWSSTIDTLEMKSREMAAKEFGVEIVQPSPDEMKKLEAATAGVKDSWIKDMAKKRLPGQEAYEAMIDSKKNYGFIFNQTWVRNRAMKK